MHNYSIDNHPKEKILFLLAFIAISITPWINEAFKELVNYFELDEMYSSGIVTAVPVFVVFGLIYFLFDNCLWKVAWLRRVLLVPDLNGEWDCEGKTIIKNGEKVSYDWKADVTVKQSWSKINIHLQTENSESKSIAASIYHEPGVGYRLLYQFSNDPKADQIELEKHSGNVELLFNLECSKSEGHYFTDRHRSTVGTMKLSRKGEAQ